MNQPYSVYYLSKKGYSNKQIAEKINIKQSSVRSYISTINRRIKEAYFNGNHKQVLCCNCGYPKRSIRQTGSFLCDYCQDIKFKRLQKIANKGALTK